MSFMEIYQTLKNLISFIPKDNKLKRRAENSPNYSGLTKYRKVNSYFPKTISKPFEEFDQPYMSNEMTDSLNEYENRFFKTNVQSKGMKHQTFADIEFSDDEDDDNEQEDIMFVPNKFNRNLLLKSKSRINNGDHNERPVLSEENYKKKPVVYNVPIKIERKLNPPPLRHVRTGNILESTCTLPIYPIQKSKNNISNGFNESQINNYENLIHQKVGNNSKLNNSPKFMNSLISKTCDLQEKEKYFHLLASIAPSLYKSEKRENDGRVLTNRGTLFNNVDLTNVRSKLKPREIISLIDDEDDDDNQPREFIDLCDDEIKGISKYDKQTENENNKSKELPYVEPVNSLKQKLTLQPKLQANWLSNFKGKYIEKSILRKKQIQEEEENLKKLTEETAKQEESLRNRLKNVILDTEPILLDVYEEEEVEFPELTQEQIELIRDAIYKEPSDQILISKFNINITRNDIRTLASPNWLNDEVINFYMNLLMERGEKRHSDGYPKVYAMNTFFLVRLMQSGFKGVSRWTRKVDLFSYDVIPIPVHVGGMHWCMAIIHLKNRTIKYYDSMGTPNPKVLNVLEQYLRDEAADKKKITLDTSGFTKECVADLPRQMNGSDCGVFSCMFAEYITRNKELTFTQQNMSYFRQKMILEIITGKLML